MKPFYAVSMSMVLLSSAAHANSPMGSPVLTYNSSSRSGPAHSRSIVCKITSTAVKKTVKASEHMGGTTTSSSKVAYTSEVQNIAEIRRLIREAARGEFKREGRPRVGGLVISYNASTTAGAEPVLLKRARGVGQGENSSPAARKLVEFIDYNCLEQN